ncbi:hypothetical protein [Stygiolobus caldivivus]|uniref:Uncharacterized protein n=1 Tax=Stygiolobus caldivivus TaxID=2824673 RepID=A0A8D5ZJZ8_9CREN|nr:hypothetical protein [Stygiolobus caldivivus]BCU70875.1 hypothetical protein KN1_21720 [Stygiolobus caldivivus]
MNKITLIGIVLVVVGIILFVADSTIAPTLIKPTMSGAVQLKPSGTANLSYPASSIVVITYNSSGPIKIENLPSTSAVNNVSGKQVVTIENINSTSGYVTFYNPNPYSVSVSYVETITGLAQATEIGVLFLGSIALFIIGIILTVVGFLKSRRKPSP